MNDIAPFPLSTDPNSRPREILPCPDSQADRCRMLWLMVLTVALTEGTAEERLDWLMSRDGREVCELAGVDAAWAAERFVDMSGKVVGWNGRGKGRPRVPV